MPAAWPTGVPECFTLETFGSGIGNGLLRTDSDMGPPKVRRRFTAVTRPLIGTVVMSYDQLATLENFIAEELGGGSLPFTFSSQRDPNDVLVMFNSEQQSDLLPWTKVGVGKVAVQLNLIILP